MNTNVIKRNVVLYYLQQICITLTQVIALGTVFCTFLLEMGLDETRVSVCVTVFQIVQTTAMLLLSRLAENKSIVLKGLGISYFFFSLIIVIMLFISIKAFATLNVLYVIILVIGAIVYLFVGLSSIFIYKAPHLIMDIKDYGKITGQVGVLSGIAGIAFSLTMSFFCNRFEYFKVMIFVCLFGIALSFTAGIIGFLYTPIESDIVKSEKTSINIFRYKPFYQLLFPNLVRGISQGIAGLAAVIGYHCELLDSASAIALATVSQIAMFLSSQCYSFVAKKQINALVCLISGIGSLIAYPAMMIGKSKFVFLAFYAVAYFFMIAMGNGIPVLVAERIDYNCLGQFTAWRMGVFALGAALGGALVPILLNLTGALVTLTIAGLTIFVCGLGYYLFDKSITIN